MKKLFSLFAVFALLTFYSQYSFTQTTLVNSTFEIGDPTVWSLSNVAATNVWIIGAATASTGTNSAYITTNAGATNSYSITTTSTNHIYTSVTFPAGQTAILLSFDWKGSGEPSAIGQSTFDYIRVSLTSAAPVGGTFPVVADQLPVIFTGGSGYAKGWIVIPSTYAGLTRNLVFTWRNDGSLGNSTPGPAIDNILLTSNSPTSLTGFKTIFPGGDYNSFGEAIANLNAHGVGAGGVTFNVSSGLTFNETPPAITVSGTAANQIIFQRSGFSSNPKVNSIGTGNFGPVSTGSVTGSGDGVLVISGSDYVTFDGIDVSCGNFAGTSSCIEYGYLLRNSSSTDGAQYNTIKNMSVTLNRTNTFPSVGIIQSISTNQGGITPTSLAGTNSNNKYYNFAINNSYAGIYLLGAAAFPDASCEVGITSGGASTIGSASTNDIGNGSSITWGIRATSQNGVKIFNCEVRNLTGTSTNTVDGIWLDNSGSTTTSIGINEVYNNVIHDISNTSTSTTSHILSGIRANLTGNAGSVSRIYNNLIHSLNNTSLNTTTRQIIGIRIQDGGTGVGATHNINNNSVRIAPTNLSCNNTCFEIGTTSGPVINVRNNIFANFTGAQTTVKHFCWVTTSTTLVGNTGSISNYNILYINNSTNGFVGLTNTTDRATLVNWQTAFTPNQDLNSYSFDPQFISNTDLHINPSASTPVESNGTPIAFVSTDIDGDARNVSTPDIGADEGTFTPLASMTYVSSTTTQNNTNGLGQGNTNAEIIGIQVVMSGSTNPLNLTSLDLNTNGSTNAATDITNAKVWYTGTSSTFSTTTQFGSTFSGPSGPFTVSGSQTLSQGTNYFWVTYDISGSATPGNFVDAECNSVTGSGSMGVQVPGIQAPAGSRTIAGPLAGTYTVGLSMMKVLSGKNLEFVARTRKVKTMVPYESDYGSRTFDKTKVPGTELNSTKHYDVESQNKPMKETLVEETYYEIQENGKIYDGPMYIQYDRKSSNQNGFIGDMLGNYATITAALADLNTRGVSGAVTFLLIDANYAGETYPLQFNNNIAGISAVNNVTLKPQTGISATIPGNISANATIRVLSNYVTIDGSNSGGTDRSLTIQNNSVTTPSVVLFGSTGTTPITNVTLKNCIITNGVNTSSAVVISDATTLGTAGYFNTVTIQNNLIERAYVGVYATGGTSPQNGSNLFCYNNSLNTSGTNAIRYCGLYMQGVNTSILSQNTIANFNGTSSEDDRGIWLATGSINATVERNRISALNYTGTGGYGGQGIVISPAVVNANITVKNNMLYNLTGDGWSYTSIPTDNPIGIALLSTVQSGINIYNNSIFMSGNTLNQTSALSMGIFIGTSNTGIDLRNNIIVNNLGLLSATGQGAASIFVQSAASQLTTSSYNCYYSNPTGNGTKEIGRIVTTGQTTIAGWRTATGLEVQSFSNLPLFTSSTDLHIQSADLSVSGRGNFIAGNNDDYDGNSRPVSQSTSVKPVDVGCDQYSVSAFATGNVCSFSGTTYFDGGLRAIEVFAGTCTTGPVRQFSGVKTPNNTMLKMINPVKINETIKNNNKKGNNNPVNKTKKDGTSGGTTDAMAVNTPWVYWEIDNLVPTAEPLTLRFYYNDDQMATILESDIKLSYWNGSEWLNYFTQSVDAVNNYIEVTLPIGQSWPSTSLFAIEDQNAPLPVVLSSFDLSVNKRDIALSWTTESEINNKGFAVERRIKTQDGQYSVWKEVAFVNGSGNSNNRINYTYTDKKLISGAYQYRLKQIDYNGNYEYHAPANNSDVIIGKPGSFDVSQNYPNPSNPNSKIDFSMPFDGKVSIKVYDILGKEVASLINEFKPADFYTVEFDGTNIASGTYFYRIIAEGDNQKFTKTLKMILVK
jgi:hypothetical protein